MMNDNQYDSDYLPRIGAVDPIADAKLVEECEELLGLARSGDLQGIAYISYLTGKNLKWGVVGPEMQASNLRTYGLLHWLADRIMRRWDSQKEEVLE